ncbi:MAG: hypothetical protein CMO80_11495 [Verrucomicrobiales bacterium]|nr:hypothetical protein [Verrucomicrobiales bacterium]
MSDTAPEEKPKPTEKPKRSRKRFILLALLTLGLASIPAILILEIGIRIALPHYNPNRQVAYFVAKDGTPLGPTNKTVIQRTPKGDYNVEITFNELGIRDDKLIGDATANDWITLGDSFTHGHGVEEHERYGNVTAELLQTNVYNLAIPTDMRGYQKLMDYGLRHGAVISNLVIGICMENDLLDYSLPVPETAPSLGPIRKLRRIFKQNSALYLFLSIELQRRAAIRKLLESVGIARRVDHPDLFLRNDLSDEAMQSCIDRLEPLIAEVRHAIFVIIPSRGLWMGNNREKERSIHESFVERLRELSPHVVDLRSVMEKNGPALDNYFKTDPHWNATGHKLAGEELATKILYLSEGP